MLHDRSFSDIFNELIEPETAPAVDFSSGWESHLDPHGIAQLLAGLPSMPALKGAFPKAYAAVRRPPAPRKPHMMNTGQTAALGELRRHCAHLSDAFTSAELKSAFRQCALKTHPDRGGHSETFQLVKKSYHILQALVKNET